MNKVLARELGFLGVNVDSNFDIAWLKTEIADKIREGDETSIYKLVNFARHSEDAEIRRYANIIANLYQDKLDGYNHTNVTKKEDSTTEYTEAETAEDVTNAIAEAIEAGEPANVEITENIDLSTSDTKNIIIPDGAEVKVKIADGVEVSCEKEAFKVENGGTLTLTGNGTLKTTTKKTNAAVSVDGENANLVIDGIMIDALSANPVTASSSYGVYLSNDASMTFKSGVIKAAASAISTNNTTGGNTEINIEGGELYSGKSYAIYLPAQGTVNITGGKVQGINARMGVFNISGDAEIIETEMNETNYDNIGKEFNTSGCVWVGDTIAVMAGTYTDKDGTDAVFNISGNVTVASKFRSAIGVYTIDTKAAQNVTINVEDESKVTTSDKDFTNIRVYDHDYILNEATNVGKNYNPKVDSTVTINVGGKKIYPVEA